ncbi:MAG: DUF4126 domain-containing protein [Cyanobacteria bacterium J06639_1]
MDATSLAPIGQILLGLSLAATAGLRAWLPLLAVGLLGRTGAIALNTDLSWLQSDTAIVAFLVATVLEIAADKIPAVDSFTDSFGLIVKPIAGALVMSSTLSFADPAVALLLGAIAGGTTAEVVEVGKASTRLAANTLTLGTSAPVLSVAEDGAAAVSVVLALLMPYLMGILALGLLLLGLFALPRLGRSLRRRFRSRRGHVPSNQSDRQPRSLEP